MTNRRDNLGETPEEAVTKLLEFLIREHRTAQRNAKDKRPTIESTRKIVANFWRKRRRRSTPAVGASSSIVLATIIFTLTLLYRRGWLDVFGEDPCRTVLDILHDQVSADGDSSLAELYPAFVRASRLERFSEVWKHLRTAPRRQISLLYWGKLPALGWRDGEHKKVDLRAAIELFITPLNGANKAPRLNSYRLTATPLCTGGYDSYRDNLHTQMRLYRDAPDLVLLDTIDIALYHDMGSIVPISQYNEMTDVEWPELKLLEHLAGRDEAGSVLAIPATVNWHEAALSKNCMTDADAALYKAVRKHHGLEKTDKPHAPDLKELVHHETYMAATKDKRTLGHACALIIPKNGGLGTKRYPIIPMQAAAGAHVTYTFFAYTANLAGHQRAFLGLQVDPQGQESHEFRANNRLVAVARGPFIERVTKFLQAAYIYTPVIALCLDHETAAHLRSEYTYWFDPCLPREAGLFQTEGAPGQPCYSGFAYDGGTACKLSCLGGYCIAMLSRTEDRWAASGVAVELAEHLHQHCWKDTGGRSDDLLAKKVGAVKTTRPSVKQWRAIEDIISETVRRYLFAVFMFREKWGQLAESVAGVSGDGFIETNFDDLKNGLNACEGKQVQEFVDTVIKDIEPWVKAARTADMGHSWWAKAQLEPLAAAGDEVAALVRKLLFLQNDSGRNELDFFEGGMNVLAKSLVNVLYLRIKAFCFREGLAFHEIDSVD